MVRTKASRATAPVMSAVMRRAVRQIVDSRLEHKRNDQNFTATSSSAGAVTPITQGIIQGDNVDQRSGDRIFIRRMKFIIRANNVNGTAGAPGSLRVVLVADRLNSGSIPAVTDILASATYYDGYNSTSMQSQRFLILKDEFFPTVQGQMNSHLIREWTFRKPIQVSFNGATAVTASNGKNCIFMLFIDSGANTTYFVGLNIAYTDA